MKNFQTVGNLTKDPNPTVGRDIRREGERMTNQDRVQEALDRLQELMDNPDTSEIYWDGRGCRELFIDYQIVVEEVLCLREEVKQLKIDLDSTEQHRDCLQ